MNNQIYGYTPSYKPATIEYTPSYKPATMDYNKPNMARMPSMKHHEIMGPYEPDDPNNFGKRVKMSDREKRARRRRRQLLACSSQKETKTMTKKQKKMRKSYRKMKSYMKNC